MNKPNKLMPQPNTTMKVTWANQTKTMLFLGNLGQFLIFQDGPERLMLNARTIQWLRYSDQPSKILLEHRRRDDEQHNDLDTEHLNKVKEELTGEDAKNVRQWKEFINL